ncbi:unnamed protein product [Penicillium roqueforti FM164]|uniref:Genomic scaffold, ProqFM164S02 n=1 Tax=Penicillium roqueforti (strain FM164) TaxID=1365484 RepID=W6QTZ3_PENRF|nr:unnamed protein product [Penicillium roqueforti FM164]
MSAAATWGRISPGFGLDEVPISTEETVKPVDIHRKRGTHCALGSGQG